MMWEVRKQGEVLTGRKVPWLAQGQVSFVLSAGDRPVEVEIADNVGRKRVLEVQEKGDFRIYSPSEVCGSGLLTVKVKWSAGDCSCGHFLVRPEWLDAVTLVSVVPRSLGSLEQWGNRLRELADLGYSMVHFAPIQTQNRYKSHYCLSNHLELNPDFFPGSPEARLSALTTLLTSLRATTPLKFMQDIVLNHASVQSPLFQSTPDSAYTPSNSPYLASAVELDLALQALGMEVAEGTAQWYQYGREVRSAEQVEAVVRRVEDWLLPGLRLEEYFQMDEDREVRRLSREMEGVSLLVGTTEGRKCVGNLGVSRFGCEVRANSAGFRSSQDLPRADFLYRAFVSGQISQ